MLCVSATNNPGLEDQERKYQAEKGIDKSSVGDAHIKPIAVFLCKD